MPTWAMLQLAPLQRQKPRNTPIWALLQRGGKERGGDVMDVMRRHGETAKNTHIRQRQNHRFERCRSAGVKSVEGMLWILCGVMEIRRKTQIYDNGEKDQFTTTARRYRARRGCYGCYAASRIPPPGVSLAIFFSSSHHPPSTTS